MIKPLSLSVAAAATFLAFASSSHAQTQVISQQFYLYNQLAPGMTAGAAQLNGAPVGNFNVATQGNGGDDSDSTTDKLITGAGLVNQAGTVTSIGYSLSFDAQFETADSIPQNTDQADYFLLRASFFTRRATDTPSPLSGTTLSLTGLIPSDTYNLFVYIISPVYGSGSTAVVQDDVSGGAFNVTTNNSLTTLTQVTGTGTGNYVEFTGITGSTTEDVMIPGATFVGLSGFQLVDMQVPEPSTMCFVGLGLLGGVFYVRRNRSMRVAASL